MNDKIKKQIEEARKAEFDLTDTLDKHNDIPIDEYLENDIERNLSNYGMHIEEYPESIVYMDITPYDENDIKELVKEYKYYILANPSKIDYYLTEFANDLLDIDGNEED